MSLERLARIKAAAQAGDIDALRHEYQDWVTEEQDKRAAVLEELDAARVALAEALIPLEALYAAEHDDWALSPETIAAIRGALVIGRAALFGRGEAT